MNSIRSKRRYSSIPSLLGLVLISPGVLAGELPLRAFDATYHLHERGMHIASAELSLRREGESWHWRMTTEPRSVYAWLIDRRPVNETRLVEHDNGYRLQQITLSDASRPERRESARFDWETGRLSVLRKGRRHEIMLQNEVYDFHSIHLLAAEMARDGLERKHFDFYRKGKLVDSSIHSNGGGRAEVRGRKLAANIFEQVTARSRSVIKYYYDAVHPYLPLRIEKLERGESSTLLTLQRVDWKL